MHLSLSSVFCDCSSSDGRTTGAVWSQLTVCVSLLWPIACCDAALLAVKVLEGIPEAGVM